MTLRGGKVLVLGSGTRSFLTVIRSLGRHGLEVHAAWCPRDSVALRSRYVRHFHQLTRPPSLGWQDELRELLQREKFCFVVPCNDPSILPLHAEREAFAEYPLYLIDASIFDMAMDKAAVNQVARSAGVRLPKEVLIQTLEDVNQLASLQGPLVLKPTRSYVAERLSKKNHVAIVQKREDAITSLGEMLRTTPVAVQEYFDGLGVGVEFLAKNGEILFAFQHERIHEPPEGGGSSYRKSCPLDDRLRDDTQKLVQALRYTGVGMAEFRYNKYAQQWIFVELNSRFWGSLPLAVACGADFPRYLYQMWCEGRTEFSGDYQIHRVCRNWMLDLQWFRKSIEAAGLSIRRLSSLFLSLVLELRYPVTLRESSDTLTWDDPSPGVQEIRESLAAIPRRIGRKLGSMGFLRKRSRARALTKLRQARSWLFVCKGNICRSPFAALYAQSRVPSGISVQSAGYFPKSDRPSPDVAVTSAATFGVDLAQHRSAVVNDGLVASTDVIVVFDEENRREMRSRFPALRSRIVMLGNVLEHGEIEIADPYGGTVEQFQQTYKRIAQSLDQISG